MKQIILIIAAIISLSGNSYARDEYVKGYVTKNGGYVAPHYRTTSDSNPYNNYSTRGNSNPYTGQQGNVDPYNNSYNTYGNAPKTSNKRSYNGY